MCVKNAMISGGQDIKLWLAEIPYNIVTSDGRYHKDYKRDFFLSFDKNGKNQSEKDYSFINLVSEVTEPEYGM